MLPKKNKLNLSKPANRGILKQAGKTTRHFKIAHQPHALDGFQAAVVVPVKLVKSAVLRNKLRRQGYAALQHHPINKKNIKLVVMYIKAPKTSCQQLELELRSALNELMAAMEID